MRWSIFIFFLINCSILFGQEVDNKTFEIPLSKSGNTSNLYNTIIKLSKQIDLELLEKGVDSMEIRIWYFFPKSPDKFDNLLIIRWEKDQWIGQKHSSGFASFQPKRKTWSMIVDKLIKNRIFELQNMYDIEGFNYIVKDGSSYFVEVAKKNFYRCYYYTSPSHFKQFKDAKSMNKIITFLNKEL